MTQDELFNKVVETIGKVIFNFNIIEQKINTIISLHIQAKEDEFLQNHMLNSSIISFGAKIKLLKQILEKINLQNKELITQITQLNTQRNTFAHSNLNAKSEIDVNQDVEIIDIKLKNKMNAQGKITQADFFTSFNRFKTTTLEVEEKLDELIKQLSNT